MNPSKKKNLKNDTKLVTYKLQTYVHFYNMTNRWHEKGRIPQDCNFSKPLSYIDSKNQEWIILLGCGSGYDGSGAPITKINYHAKSYVYSVEYDSYRPIISHYKQNICKKFGLKQIHAPLRTDHSSSGIDQDNAILYWLDTSKHHADDCQNGNNNYCSLLTIDISDIFHIKVLNQTIIDRNDSKFKSFTNRFEMYVVCDRVHFISVSDICQHFVFDRDSNKIRVVSECIHLDHLNTIIGKSTGVYSMEYNHKIFGTMEELWNMLKKGNKIDVQDTKYGTYYVGTISNVRDTAHPDDIGECDCVDLLIHYEGWSNRYDQWITVNKNTSLCNCNGLCCHLMFTKRGDTDDKNKPVHLVAFPYTRHSNLLVENLDFNSVPSGIIWLIQQPCLLLLCWFFSQK